MAPDGPGVVAAAVGRYAQRFHHWVGDEHHVASPLGAWLLLALVAPAAEATDRARLEEVVGLPADRAAAAAGELLADPHPAVLAGAAAWRRAGISTPGLDAWLGALAGVAQVADLPDQAEADAWAAERTAGLIRKFPLEIDPDTLLVIASALACKITWTVPFLAVHTTELALPPAPGFDGLRRVLLDPGAARRQAIVASPDGPLAVHAASSADGDLVVVSVAAPPDVRAGDVLARAQPIAHAIATDTDFATHSLFDLALGVGHAWTITEETARVLSPDGREERYRTLLPAWSAQSEHDLGATAELGFGTAASALAALLPPDPRGHAFEAKQVALARYTRTGFEAAAITAIAQRAGAAMPQYRDGVVRTARLEFVRPFAVVAVAAAPWGGSSRWAGLPVFSGWVTAPDEAD